MKLWFSRWSFLIVFMIVVFVNGRLRAHGISVGTRTLVTGLLGIIGGFVGFTVARRTISSTPDTVGTLGKSFVFGAITSLSSLGDALVDELIPE